MLLYFLVFGIVISGLFLYYSYYIAPRLNPKYKAEQYLKNGKIFDAIIEFKKALDKKPDDFEIHAKLADIYLNENEIDQAVSHLEKVLALNKYNYAVEKTDIQKKLAKAYDLREEYEKALQLYLEILTTMPMDVDSLYYIAFTALGQEEFEIAQRYFDKLVKLLPNNFEVNFATGICCYQNQKTNDAVNYFKTASSLHPSSDIANLALAFALQRKSDYRQALLAVKKINEMEKDREIVFVTRRLRGILLLQSRNFDEAVKVFQELLDYLKKNDMQDAVMMTLFDLGFVCIKAEKTALAYQYWNELYEMDKSYKKIQHLVTLLRKEMDVDYKLFTEEDESSIEEHFRAWLEETFPKDFLWQLCGLKSDKEINIRGLLTSTRISKATEIKSESDFSYVNYDNIEQFNKMNVENFRITANRLVSKLGYKVDQILTTYRESDGVDFLAVTPEKEKVLIWVRRWIKTKVGEIPLRNFAQAINDMKASKGIFITSSELTPSAENSLSNLSKVQVIRPDELASLLEGLV
ncbi:MAG: tetratricopeptide repeat protein [Spirochaetes bacterium]|nr:tetratricopeptide repeat protein [Spirochaetota bacterium]